MDDVDIRNKIIITDIETCYFNSSNSKLNNLALAAKYSKIKII